MKLATVLMLLFAVTGCGKVGMSGSVSQFVGNWAQIKLPDNCVPRQISAEEGNGVAVLCVDGRVFH